MGSSSRRRPRCRLNLVAPTSSRRTSTVVAGAFDGVDPSCGSEWVAGVCRRTYVAASRPRPRQPANFPDQPQFPRGLVAFPISSRRAGFSPYRSGSVVLAPYCLGLGLLQTSIRVPDEIPLRIEEHSSWGGPPLELASAVGTAPDTVAGAVGRVVAADVPAHGGEAPSGPSRGAGAAAKC